jgi:DNA-binding NtrC family response regulator
VRPAPCSSELFGHERGAFTDAHKQKKGLLELADGGSVFLDEIGEMGTSLQAKLLRFLEEKTFKRVGGSEDVRVDVRVIAATNRDLEQMVRDGRFREDLYYRLRVLPVELPPLAARTGDIPQLVRLFLGKFSREFGKAVEGASPQALAALEAHGWPGNVRELRNVVERAVLLAETLILGPGDFRLPGRAGAAADAVRLGPSGLDFEALERSLVVQALELAIPPAGTACVRRRAPVSGRRSPAPRSARRGRDRGTSRGATRRGTAPACAAGPPPRSAGGMTRGSHGRRR